MAVIDIAGFVTELKDHAIDHGFHVHDERHFVETYSLRQAWEVDVHPEDGCGGPIDLHLALEVEPRTLLAFEDLVMVLDDLDEIPDQFELPLTFTWALPPLPNPPDMLATAMELAGIGGMELPLDTSASDSYASATERPERRMTIVGRHDMQMGTIMRGESSLCGVYDRAMDVSRFLLDRVSDWLGDDDNDDSAFD